MRKHVTDYRSNSTKSLRLAHAVRDVLQRGLKVMDGTAITLCMENRLPVIVFSMFEDGNIERVVRGEELGTRIGS